MDNNLALEVLKAKSNEYLNAVPFPIIEACYQVMSSKQFDKDTSVAIKQFEDIVDSYIDSGDKS